jgi:hypothetical protein
LTTKTTTKTLRYNNETDQNGPMDVVRQQRENRTKHSAASNEQSVDINVRVQIKQASKMGNQQHRKWSKHCKTAELQSQTHRGTR